MCVFFMAEMLPNLTRLSKIFQTENLSFTSIKPAVTCAKITQCGVDIISMNNTFDWQHELSTYKLMHCVMGTLKNL